MIVEQHVCFVKDRGTCSSMERNIKIWWTLWIHY